MGQEVQTRLYVVAAAGADPHRSNILNPMYQDVGIGIVKAGWGYYFFVDFGGR
jgi:uncharacterized protein YkwD